MIHGLVTGFAVKQLHDGGKPRDFVENNLRGGKRFISG